MDGQIGLEDTPDAHVARLVEVFEEVRRVLRDDGTLWLNYGDAYATGAGTNSPGGGSDGERARECAPTTTLNRMPIPGLKPKDLIGLSWLLAFALRAAGWYLRCDVVWHKPNPMPESVRDRPTKSHEHVFLFSKRARYFYDGDAVREPVKPESVKRCAAGFNKIKGDDHNRYGEGFGYGPGYELASRNLRDVWTIPTQPYPEAHFATFPEELARRCILAGTSERGVCPACGSPWARVVEAEYDAEGRTTNGPRSTERRHESPGRDVRMVKRTHTTGWLPCCDCGAGDAIPATVLDPFAGSGTVGAVCERWGRRFIGIELNPEYAELAEKRIAQSRRKYAAPLFS